MAKIDGTPQRLYLMQVSAATIPTANGPLEMSTACYLIQTSDGKNVLIDSGLPADYTPPPGMPPADNGKNVIEQLADLGLRPDDIDLLLCTHFDIDHAGYLDAFVHAELIVQREHDERARSGEARYAAARSGEARYAAARTHWDHPALRYQLIDGDTEILPGLMLIESSGHAPGQQTVLVRLPHTGPVLLAIDAVVMQRLFTPDRRAWPTDDNEEQVRASTRKLLDLVERERVALVVFGHDGQQWQTLTKAPGYYE